MNIEKNSLYDKIYACWLGKNIGGTLGEPVEGCKDFMSLTFYPRLSDSGSLPNDDLDLQLVNLHAVEEYGINLTAEHLGREWTEHVYFPYDEYGYAATALRHGFTPPFSGIYNNPFTNCMGSPIRSELWAALAHGKPSLAAYFAWHDAVVDHAGGEGLYGEMFYAALEAMAYERTVKSEYDRVKLISDALAYIPTVSRTAKALADMLKWYSEGVGYIDIRQMILDGHGNANFTDAPQNIAFTMVGFLYGENFEDGILKAVNLGYDTDCTGATLGALYGILYGTEYIPEKWSSPIGTNIVVSAAVRGFNAPANLDELTRRTITLSGILALADESKYKIGDEDSSDFEYQRYVFPNGATVYNNMSADIKYIGGASIKPFGEKKIQIKITNNSKAKWRFTAHISCPDGFCAGEDKREITLASGESADEIFTVNAGDIRNKINRLSLVIERINDNNIWAEYEAGFTLLRASRWILDGEVTYVDGNEVHFKPNADGIHTAQTSMYNNKARDCRMMFASCDAVKAVLDGNIIVDADGNRNYMPAFHRCYGDQAPILPMYAGEHTIDVTLKGETGYFLFAPLSTNNNTEPGAFYYYTDTIIG